MAVVINGTTGINKVDDPAVVYDSELEAQVAPFNHGFKNYIINGGFDIWQRGTIFSVAPGSSMYTSDRWIVWNRSNQPVTVEIADNKGLSNLGVSPRMRIAYAIAPTTGDIIISQKIEDVKRLSSKTFTGSFYHSTLENFNIRTYSLQNYGTGGSSDTAVENGSQTTAGDLSFKRYSATFNIPDFKDKTIGNSSWVDFTIVAPIRTTKPLSIAQVQLEEGSVATPFEQRPIGLELSLCQYFLRPIYVAMQNQVTTTSGQNTTQNLYFPSMRTVPTVINQSVVYAGSINSSGVASITKNSIQYEFYYGALNSLGACTRTDLLSAEL